MKRIITFSRRTDGGLWIEFLVDKDRQGYCFAPNPMTNKPYKVSLAPADVALLTLWTKAPHLIVPHVAELSSRHELAFFVTVTGYAGSWLEPRVPGVEETIEGVRRLFGALGKNPDRFFWRYDPIITTKQAFTAEWHAENFATLCKQWKGMTKRVIVSNVQVLGSYAAIEKKISAGARARGDAFVQLSYAAFVEVAARLRSIAAGHGIALQVCCSPAIADADQDAFGVANGACLDPAALVAFDPAIARMECAAAQRQGSAKLGYGPCLCSEARDIGSKETCAHGCVYCYSNRSGGAIQLDIPPSSPWLSSKPFPGASS